MPGLVGYLYRSPGGMAAVNLAMGICGSSTTTVREKDDFYATPPEYVESFLNYETPPFFIWEPCCGDGAISKILTAHGHKVLSTDLVSRGFGEGGVDFLTCEVSPAPAIITNPPFKLAPTIILHAKKLKVGYLALLLKATFWHAKTRHALFEAWQPARIYPMGWRPDFRGQGAPPMDCLWCVWDGESKTTAYIPMKKHIDPFA